MSIDTEKPIWLRAKFVYSIIGALIVYAVVVTLVLTGKITVTSEQIFNFGEWILGFLLGGHAATDITNRIMSVFGKTQPVAEKLEPAPEPEPEPEPKDEEKPQ